MDRSEHSFPLDGVFSPSKMKALHKETFNEMVRLGDSEARLLKNAPTDVAISIIAAIGEGRPSIFAQGGGRW
jgi:hypothetical protein